MLCATDAEEGRRLGVGQELWADPLTPEVLRRTLCVGLSASRAPSALSGLESFVRSSRPVGPGYRLGRRWRIHCPSPLAPRPSPLAPRPSPLAPRPSPLAVGTTAAARPSQRPAVYDDDLAMARGSALHGRMAQVSNRLRLQTPRSGKRASLLYMRRLRPNDQTCANGAIEDSPGQAKRRPGFQPQKSASPERA